MIVGAGADLIFTAPQRLANLTVDGGKVTLSTSAVATDATAINLLTLLNGGRVDIANQDVLLDRVANPVQTVRQLIAIGFNGGAWNGAGGIGSSIVGTNSAAGWALGYADGLSGLVVGVPSNKVLVRYTVAADANLDRAVDFRDLVIFAQNYNTLSSATFDEGDFNYDGKVNFVDLVMLAQRYGTTLAAPALSVPEVIAPVAPARPAWLTDNLFSLQPVKNPAAKAAKAVLRRR